MKTILVALIGLFFSSCVIAQNQDQVLARVRYSLIHERDTTKRNDPYTENMLLLIGKNESLYTSYDRINKEINAKKQDSALIKNQAGGGPIGSTKVSNAPFKPTTLIDYYFFANENKWITKDRVITTYLIEEQAPKIYWKITKDTASFSGIKCQKATAHFKGRNWIAWYAPSLPFSSGPWKLNGLPGLIIEAHDEKKEVQLQFAGIDKVTKDNTIEDSFYFSSKFKMPTAAKNTTRPAFDKLKAAFDKDPKGFHSAESGIPRARIFTGVSTTGTIQTVINNPIELPEK